ncbi:MAG: DNA-binding protein [Lachnospiraceae bacterium]|nr:DNA-binding protein [Lachnospiraceae bacterium]MCM1217268.1 DNA-binding protein [Lachnospiraceae bacterium]
MDETKVTVKQAARELHMGILTVQYLMRDGKLPIGYTLKREGRSRYTYHIFRGLLDQEKKRLGIE